MNVGGLRGENSGCFGTDWNRQIRRPGTPAHESQSPEKLDGAGDSRRLGHGPRHWTTPEQLSDTGLRSWARTVRAAI
jgi:hypothetical protein